MTEIELNIFDNFINIFSFKVKDIMSTLSQRTLEHRHGSILTLSHACQRRIKKLKSESDFHEEKIQNWAELKKVVILLGELISSLDVYGLKGSGLTQPFLFFEKPPQLKSD